MIFLITHASLIWPFPPFSSYDSINLNNSQRLQSYFKISWAGSDQQIFNLELTINQFSSKGLAFFITHTSHQIATCKQFIAELAEHSPIIIQNSSNPSSWKNLDVRPYNHMTVQGATYNMRGQLYHGHTNTMALSSSPVVSALGSDLDDPGSSPGGGKVLCPWDVLHFKARLNLYIMFLLWFLNFMLADWKSMQATQIILKGLGGAYSWVKTFNLNQTKTNYSDF